MIARRILTETNDVSYHAPIIAPHPEIAEHHKLIVNPETRIDLLLSGAGIDCAEVHIQSIEDRTALGRLTFLKNFAVKLLDQEHGGKRLMSCGRPCPGIELQVADESGKEVEPGQRGELIARGANVMRGYWNNEKDTAAAFRNGFFRTGDLGYQAVDGYFYILDRLKDMIVTGGENVYSGEVEAVILDHPAVREVAVFGIPDPQWGELVAACVVLKPGMIMTTEELIRHCRQSLATYKVPRHVEFSETDLPKSGSGKVLKRVLRERFWAGAERHIG